MADLKNIIKEANKEVIESIETLSKQVNGLITENQNLKTQVKLMQDQRERDQRRLLAMEDQLKQRNLIFKGLDAQSSLSNAVKHVCEDKLKITTPIIIKSTKKIYDRNGKMGVLVEMDSEEIIQAIFKQTKNLAGTAIIVERDLNTEKQQHRKVMLQLKKDIVAENRSQLIRVRNERIQISGKWMSWNRDKELMCGRQKASEVLSQIYGDAGNNISINYEDLLSRSNLK